ncbi:MAG: hypothetical protein JEY94_02895 [Melioribacteraceae bacterium]|nr:hypothetical protein [Melioribacteraceae bacterium]
MSYIVPKKIIAKAAKCNYNHSCVETGKCNGYDLCKVEDTVGLDVLFIEYRNEHSCGYMLNYGNSYMCTCPVRKYIFNKYKK